MKFSNTRQQMETLATVNAAALNDSFNNHIAL